MCVASSVEPSGEKEEAMYSSPSRHGVSWRCAPVRRSTVQMLAPLKPSFFRFPPTVVGSSRSIERVKAIVCPSGEYTGSDAPRVPWIGWRPLPSARTVKSFRRSSWLSPWWEPTMPLKTTLSPSGDHEGDEK